MEKRVDIDDPFSDFDRMFEEMRRRMDALMRGSAFSLEDEPVQVTYRRIEKPDLGPEEFAPGPMREIPSERYSEEEDEPLVDVREKDGKVTVLVELPGTCKEDIDLHVSGKRLSIDVNTAGKDFSREVSLPCSVKARSTKANYRNGVLEVILDKAPPRKKGTKVRVE